MDSLFPKMPKDITALGTDELAALTAEHMVAVDKIEKDDPEYLQGYTADEVIAELKLGVDQINALNAEQAGRAEAQTAYVGFKTDLIQSITSPKAEEAPAEENGDEENGDEADEPEAAAETDAPEPEGDTDDGDEDKAEAADDRVPVLASAEPEPVRMLRPPAPAADRVVVNEPEKKALNFVASGLLPVTPPGKELPDSMQLANAVIEKGKSLGAPSHGPGGREERFQVAHLDYTAQFDEDHTLRQGDTRGNGEKLMKVGSPFAGRDEFLAMTASGGICAPAENFYSIPQLAVQDRPVRDGLPSFRADRGAINVPVPGIVGDVAGAITVITEAEDALGGTFATKACLDVTCPTYNETAVTVIAHCREFGNLNAMSWPEFIANQNELTMAEHARIAEGFLLGQIKAQSLKVSSGAETLSALTYLMDAITKSQFGIRSRLRLPNEARFDVFLPRVTLDILLLDTIQKQFDSYRTRGDIEAYLDSVGVDVYWYMDTPLLANGVGTDGPSMIADVAQGDQAALESFPDVIQWALHPRGTFLHIDMAELNLGIVRDSTLNSTNDFQVFGETFENVARIGPPQAAYWETTDICAVGQYPPLGTARTCD